MNGPELVEPDRFEAGHAEAYATMIMQLRALQDAVVAPECGTETLQQVTKAMAALVAELGDPSEPDAAWRTILKPLPSRGRAMCPPLMTYQATDDYISGSVVFGHHFLGRNSAAHGGAVAMVFDELFGSLINFSDGFRARTAFLHVDYRRITPIQRELRVEARLHSCVGRKSQVIGSISDADGICATAEALFVRLNPGQP